MAAAQRRAEPQPATGGEQPAWQPPAYTPQQYPQYQQPTQPPTYRAAAVSAGRAVRAAATDYNPAGYPPPGQYGQPTGAYGQQYGQPGYGQPGQYGQQPGQYGSSPASTVSSRASTASIPGGYQAPGAEEGSKRSLAVVGGVVGLLAAIIVGVVLVLGFWKPGFFVTTKLDINSAQSRGQADPDR